MIREPAGGKLNWIKYGIWVPWIGLIAAMAVMAGSLHTVNPLYSPGGGTQSIVSITEPGQFFMYFTILALFVAISLPTHSVPSFGRR